MTTIPTEEFRHTYTLRVDDAVAERADALARGCYQAALLARLTAAGVPWCEVRAAHGKRCVVIGEIDRYRAEVRDAR